MTSTKPTVIIPMFVEDNSMWGFPDFSKSILTDKFKVIVERDLQQNSSLEHEVQGLCLMPGIPTELLKIETLERFKNLKVVSSVSAGYNHLPVEYLKKRGIRCVYYVYATGNDVTSCIEWGSLLEAMVLYVPYVRVSTSDIMANWHLCVVT